MHRQIIRQIGQLDRQAETDRQRQTDRDRQIDRKIDRPIVR